MQQKALWQLEEEWSSHYLCLRLIYLQADINNWTVSGWSLRGGKVKRLWLRLQKLTWTLFHAEGAVGVLSAGVVLQLEWGGVVNEGLRTLGDTSPTVVEVGAGLQKKKRWGQAWRIMGKQTASKTKMSTLKGASPRHSSSGGVPVIKLAKVFPVNYSHNIAAELMLFF